MTTAFRNHKDINVRPFNSSSFIDAVFSLGRSVQGSSQPQEIVLRSLLQGLKGSKHGSSLVLLDILKELQSHPLSKFLKRSFFSNTMAFVQASCSWESFWGKHGRNWFQIEANSDQVPSVLLVERTPTLPQATGRKLPGLNGARPSKARGWLPPPSPLPSPPA